MKLSEFLATLTKETRNKDARTLDVLVNLDGALFTVSSLEFMEDDDGDYLSVNMGDPAE